MFVLGCGSNILGQIVLASSKQVIEMVDGNELVVYESASSPKSYYYLPCKLRVSEKDGRPQVSLLTYDQNSDGIIDGAILHLLMTWGLSATEVDHADEWLITNVDSSAMISGALSVTAVDVDPWTISGIDNEKLSKLLNRNLTQSSATPNMSGGKWAASFRFDSEEAEEIESILKEKELLANTIIEFHYTFELLEDHNTRINTTVSYPLTLTDSFSNLLQRDFDDE